MNLNLKIKRVNPRAKLPTYGHKGDTCFDLRAVIDPAEGETEPKPVVIPPGGQAKFDTGLIFVYPEGWAMDVYSRSGMGFSKQLRLSNCVGVIDSSFRDTVKVALKNDSNVDFMVNDGDRIAQGRLVEVHDVTFEEIEDIDETTRGTGGLGSTGIK